MSSPTAVWAKRFLYLLTHWQTLTRFLQVPGAPLDNNIVERALKLAIRQRKNSLFYATDYSAYIASMLTSLIATCLHAGVNALEYLVALQEHRPAVFHDPAAWLPWNYHANLAPTLSQLSPIVRHPGLLGIAIPQHDRQLARRQGRTGLLGGGPPREAALRQPLRAQPVALPVIAQDFERWCPRGSGRRRARR